MKKLLIALIAVSTISTAALADNHKGKDKAKGKDQHGMIIPKKMMKGLPQDQKDAIKAIVEKNSNRDKMKALMEQRKTIVSAATFDKAAYIKNVEAMHDLREDAKENKAKINAEILSVLTPEQRTELVKIWTEKAEKMKKHKDGKKQK